MWIANRAGELQLDGEGQRDVGDLSDLHSTASTALRLTASEVENCYDSSDREEQRGFRPFSRTCEHLGRSRADIGCLKCRHSLSKERKIGWDGNRTRACARHIPQPFPRRLRPTSFRSHRVDHPPRSHRRRVPTGTTLPTHLRSVDLSAWRFASFRSAGVHPRPLDRRSPDGWVMRGDR